MGSSSAPVRQIIQNQENGLLTNFLDPESLAQNVCALLENRQLAQSWVMQLEQQLKKVQPQNMPTTSNSTHRAGFERCASSLRIKSRQARQALPRSRSCRSLENGFSSNDICKELTICRFKSF